MKFLSRALDNSNLMLIKTYYNPGSKDYNEPDDVLDIIYKDIDTGKKYVETIPNPKVEIYILKPEYRTYSYYKNFESIDKCTKYLIPYKSRYSEVAKILGCDANEAKFSNYVYQLDLDVEHFYAMQFFIEYDRKESKPLSLGFSDIESDIIAFDEFAAPGEAPPNAISYFDDNTKTMYTLVCVQDNVPHVSETHKRYELFEKLRGMFKEQTENFIKNTDKFIQECIDEFTPSYGNIDYKLFIFDNEEAMSKAYWNIFRKCDNDFCFFWNAPYDVSNLVERPRHKGIDPNELIPSEEFGYRDVYWYEDKNAVVHKRKHVFDTYTKTVIMDQMVNYAGIRSGKGKLPSTKLNAIAQTELKDEKLDYSEYGEIKMFPYLDFWKFIKYNIKDVLLQVGIERKVHDASYIYTMLSTNGLKTSEVFTSTTVVGNSLRLFALTEKKKVLGSNKNKLFKVQKTEEQIKEEKKNKFAGAFVMNPAHCTPTGFMLLGVLNKYIHDHAIDFDITSELKIGRLTIN